DAIEHPAPSCGLVAGQFTRQLGEVDARGWLSRSQLHPAFVSILQLSPAAPQKQQPAAPGPAVKSKRMALGQILRQPHDRKVDLVGLLDRDASLIEEFLAGGEFGVFTFP